MKIDLSGKIALITGSTKGIGYATAEAMASSGAHVIIHGRKDETVKAAAAKLAASQPDAKISTAYGDLGTSEGTKGLVSQLAAIGDVDILVNNAAIFEPKEFFDIPDEDWMDIFETNVLSGVRLSRALMPKMLEKNWGRIIFISSESALNIPKEMVHYGMSKTAQLSVSRGIAEYTKGTNVTVNSVLPGPTRSDGVLGFIDQIAEQSGQSSDDIIGGFIDAMRPTSLIARFADPAEVAAMVTFIASPLASATNGAALRVDGGVVKHVA